MDQEDAIDMTSEAGLTELALDWEQAAANVAHEYFCRQMTVCRAQDIAAMFEVAEHLHRLAGAVVHNGQ